MQSCTVILKLRKFFKAIAVEFAYAHFCTGVIKAAMLPDEVFSSLRIFFTMIHALIKGRGGWKDNFKNCAEVFLNALLTFTEGHHTFFFSFLLTVAYLNGNQRHKIWNILFPYNGRDIAVLYLGPGI